MESADTGACLRMVTDENLYGIRIEKLEKLGKIEVRDWKSHRLERAPFDFHLNLPEVSMKDPFIFDSKLFLTGDPTGSGSKIYQISYVGGGTFDISESVATGAIPPLPTGYHSFIGNIQDDVYSVVHDMAPGKRRTGVWVLRSSSRKWHSVCALPTELNSNHRDWPLEIVLKDKLFLCPVSAPGISYVYDPQTDAWTKLDGTFSSSDGRFDPPLVLVSSLGDVGNCSVVLTWDMKVIYGSRVKYEIHALLVDNQDYCVRRYQFLDELCKAIQPSYFKGMSTEIDAVDLGNNKVCVMIGGLAEGIPSLCILVVELGLVHEEEQRFLSVRVLANQVYDMMPCLEDSPLEALTTSFIFSLSKGMPRKHPYSQDCISSRKEPKLAGGTNPSNPTTAFTQE